MTLNVYMNHYATLAVLFFYHLKHASISECDGKAMDSLSAAQSTRGMPCQEGIIHYTLVRVISSSSTLIPTCIYFPQIYHGDIKTENVLLTGWDWYATLCISMSLLLTSWYPSFCNLFLQGSIDRLCQLQANTFACCKYPCSLQLCTTTWVWTSVL